MAAPRRRWHRLLPQAALRQLRRLSSLMGRARDKPSASCDDDASPADGGDPQPARRADPPPPTVPNATSQGGGCQTAAPAPAQTSAELEARADPQLDSALFSRLPPEVRRLIYVEVFAAFMPGGRRIHVSRDGGCPDTIIFAPCILGDAHPHGAGAGSRDPPGVVGNANERNILIDANVHADDSADPNLWWWWRWSLRLQWGNHTDCVYRAVRPRPGSGPRPAAAGEAAPLMAMFLTCNRMYSEAITTLFETTSFLFKSSSDAARFLETSQHRYTHAIRFIEFNFIYDKDCLYLHSIEPLHPRITFAGSKENPVVGIAVWNGLVAALASTVPQLSSLKVFIGAKPTADKEEFSKAFDAVGWRPRNLQLRFRDD